MDNQAIIDRIEALGEDELDDLPVGVITLDRSGKIVRYNKAEAQLARLDQRAQIGKNFFLDVAPCTANPDFEGRFRKLTEKKAGGAETFDYVFRFSWGHERVHITFVSKPNREEIDVLVTRRSA